MRTLMAFIFALFAFIDAANAQSQCADYRKWASTVANHKRIWYQAPGVSKAPQVYLQGSGCITMDARYPMIYRDLTSQNPAKIIEAGNLIEGNAIMQGRKPPPDEPGD